MRVQTVSGFLGNVEETFKQFDTNKNGNIDASALGSVLEAVTGSKPSKDEILRILGVMAIESESSTSDEVTFKQFEAWCK